MSPGTRTTSRPRSRAPQPASGRARRSAGARGKGKGNGKKSPARPAARRASDELAAPFADDVSARRARRLEAAKPPGRRSTSFLALFSVILVLNLVGLAMILSASSVSSLEDYGTPWYQFLRQFAWFLVGAISLVLALRVDYRSWRRFARVGALASGAMLVLVLVPGIGKRVNGATRWLGYGPLSIQPSEFAKLALVVFWADLLARRAKWMDDWRLTMLPALVVFVGAGGLIMLQPNLGTTLIIFLTMFVLLFVAGVDWRALLVLLAGAAGVGLAFILLFPWRARRLGSFLEPWEDPLGVGYQGIEARTAVATGGPTGTGLGQGRSKWGFLPEADTDFIYSVIAEETGFIGAVLLIALFLTVAAFGIRVAMRAPDRFGMLLATGITAWFLVQAFFNIGQSVGAWPVMGVPLPFVSSGGSSLVVSMVAAGMLLNVARQTR